MDQNSKALGLKLKTILYNDKVDEMRKFLEEEGGDANFVIQNDSTPLAMAESVEMAKLLLEHGADIHTRYPNIQNFTPLLIQAALGRPDIIQLLVDTDPTTINAKSSYGETALHLCISRGPWEKALECVKILVAPERNPKIDINAKSSFSDYTALDLAVSSRSTEYAKECILLLLRAGAEPTVHPDLQGRKLVQFVMEEAYRPPNTEISANNKGGVGYQRGLTRFTTASSQTKSKRRRNKKSARKSSRKNRVI